MANIKDATLYLWIYTGTLGSKPATPNYVLQKSVKTGDDVITFEIAELVKDYVDVKFTGDYNSITETAWVEWTMVENFDDLTTKTTSDKYIATNGYGYFKDGVNPLLKKGALINNDIIYTIAVSGQGGVGVYADNNVIKVDTTNTTADNSGGVTLSNIHIPIYTGLDGAYKADYYEGNVLLRTDVFGATITPITADNGIITADSINFTADMNLSSGTTSNIIVRVSPPKGTDRVVVTNNDSTTETIYIRVVEECKYTPFKISFLNQYGIVQDLWFFKRRDDSVNISNSEYLENTLTSTLSSGVNYSLNSATNIPTNFKTIKSIRLNTGFIDESHNEVIQELSLSQRVWIHENNTIYPVKPKTKQLNYKTSLNDKLIDFTVDFDYAFNEVNLVK